MAKFIIQGGRPLQGQVQVSGNKNEALPALFACLLTDQPVVLKNMPRIGDVLTLCEVLKSIGVAVHWRDDSTLELDAKNVNSFEPDPEQCSKARGSLLLLGPLLSRFGRIELALPGGDIIGARRIDTHWEGIQALGATLTLADKISGTIREIRGCEIFLDEPSVTGTENIVLLAVRCTGTTVIHNAACEPHVAGLCTLLNSMGAQISGVGSNRLEIRGVKNLHGTEHHIGPDFMELGSYLCLGAIAGGEVSIPGVDTDFMRFVFKTFARVGIEPRVDKNGVHIDGRKPLVMRKDLGGRVSTIYSGPWPSYPTDLMSVLIVAATQAQGTTIFFEKMFESRMFFTDKLLAMGANIVLCDPHRVVITGPSKLYASRMSSPDVRAGMALVMAALIAQGTSEIDNIYQIERGYSGLLPKLRGLGAQIERVP